MFHLSVPFTIITVPCSPIPQTVWPSGASQTPSHSVLGFSISVLPKSGSYVNFPVLVAGPGSFHPNHCDANILWTLFSSRFTVCFHRLLVTVYKLSSENWTLVAFLLFLFKNPYPFNAFFQSRRRRHIPESLPISLRRGNKAAHTLRFDLIS